MSFDEFRQRARARSVVPVWRDCLLDTDTPVTAFAKLREGPFAFLLESAPAGSETWSRYTFLGSAPRAAWRLRDGVVDDWTPERGWHGARRPTDPLADLDALIRARTPVEVRELGTFWSGAVGFFAYDVVRLIERLPSPPKKAVPVPDALFVFTDALVIIDNLRSQARVVVGAQLDDDTSDATLRAEYDRALARSRAHDREAARADRRCRRSTCAPMRSRRRESSNTTRERYLAGVERIREYILAGDAFQVQLGAPHLGAARLPERCALSRAARAQSVAVHVPPRARRRGARRAARRSCCCA